MADWYGAAESSGLGFLDETCTIFLEYRYPLNAEGWRYKPRCGDHEVCNDVDVTCVNYIDCTIAVD